MIKIKNENELINILKIFAQESVKKAKSTLNEDTAQKNYIKALERDATLYGELVKEEDEEGEEGEEDSQKDKEPEAEEPDEDEESDDTSINPSEFGSSFDKVIKDLNNLRAGKSTKNKEVKENLLDYYDRLDENERKILHLFLKQLSSILQGASGDDVQDPSEPPFSFDVVSSSSGNEAENPDNLSNKPKSQEKPSTSGSSQEDTTPPIKVNERQDLNEIRRKVKNLMKRY